MSRTLVLFKDDATTIYHPTVCFGLKQFPRLDFTSLHFLPSVPVTTNTCGEF